jgi:UDP-N-acetylglucosamine--N-acetylmuramyl-(pentapeptide) pyrophosphoryl-undecaprenol N-acetylglucosamine transferase
VSHPGGSRFAVVAGGGTGGHVLQALAVARALEARGHPAGSIELVGSRRGQEASLLAGEGFPLTLLPGRGIVRKIGIDELVANAGAVAGLAWATCRELSALARRRPRVVVSVGGYAAFPAAVAAVALGIPLVLVNIDAVPGLVHRLLGRRAAASAVAFSGTPLPRAVVTGTAVRQEIRDVDRTPASAAAARRALGIPAGRTVVGVVGGSLGARRINRAVVDLAARWAGRSDVALFHVTGQRDVDEVRQAIARAGMAAVTSDTAGDRAANPAVDGAVEGEGLSYRVVAFERHMRLLYEAADLLVCRAGAVTVAELSVAGVASVLVPLAGAPGDHQTANARALVDAGAAVLVPDERCDGAHLSEVVGALVATPGRRAAMAAAALALGRPDAADRVAEVVDAHAR